MQEALDETSLPSSTWNTQQTSLWKPRTQSHPMLCLLSSLLAGWAHLSSRHRDQHCCSALVLSGGFVETCPTAPIPILWFQCHGQCWSQSWLLGLFWTSVSEVPSHAITPPCNFSYNSAIRSHLPLHFCLNPRIPPHSAQKLPGKL